jgi:hypothetical protein
MSNSLDPTAARLQIEIPETETRIDNAIIAVSTLMASVVTARRDVSGVPAAKGQATIVRLVKAQQALVEASGDILRVHGELVHLGRETAGYDLHEECPKAAAGKVTHIHAVA